MDVDSEANISFPSENFEEHAQNLSQQEGLEANTSFSSESSEEHAQNLGQREDLDVNAQLEDEKGAVRYHFDHWEANPSDRYFDNYVSPIVSKAVSRAATLYNELPNRRKLKSDEKTVTVQFRKLNLAQVKDLMTLISQDKWAAVVYDG
jgi:hypothetical protein